MLGRKKCQEFTLGMDFKLGWLVDSTAVDLLPLSGAPTGFDLVLLRFKKFIPQPNSIFFAFVSRYLAIFLISRLFALYFYRTAFWKKSEIFHEHPIS